MNQHSKKPRTGSGETNASDEADNRRSSKESEATPDTETEIGKAEQLGERFKKPA